MIRSAYWDEEFDKPTAAPAFAGAAFVDTLKPPFLLKRGVLSYTAGKKPVADDQSAPGPFRKEKRGKKMKVRYKDRGIASASVSMYIIAEWKLKINT